MPRTRITGLMKLLDILQRSLLSASFCGIKSAKATACISIQLSIYPSIYLSTYLSIHLFVCLSVCLRGFVMNLMNHQMVWCFSLLQNLHCLKRTRKNTHFWARKSPGGQGSSVAYAYHEQSITTLGCDWTISDGSGALTGALVLDSLFFFGRFRKDKTMFNMQICW